MSIGSGAKSKREREKAKEQKPEMRRELKGGKDRDKAQYDRIT